MSLKIRLSITGKRNARHYRIVAVDESKKRDGAIVELLGYVNKQTKPFAVNVKKDRIEHWVKMGAQISPAVKKLL